ncbi:exonuclease domain-containing protein [Galbibacter sp. EGI 63066]|uniref:exonuclease domain-containing protein n=1 Tax=Galbibacter sp. EGI 63066 TaxID=2993559 RepID=UPI0022489B4B|nr:exonuclease domain-containing protein [Galbibacter sp. EGI 63066]MCX2681389.1 exonuclease domain-containing protein [Galbibacter sp. EGI 63066]
MYAILDIETTGGKYNEEGITEIAIYKFNGHEVVDQFISLVNPEKKIQPFVVKLTGINSNMLQSAPKFYEVAKRIVEITDDCTLVAHNAQFDYRILQTEFRRLGYDFKRKSLCTVELAKELIPEQPSYSLGKLVRSLGIPVSDRHRANGDAQATVKLFKMLLAKDTSKKILQSNVRAENVGQLNPRLMDIVEQVPATIGVYYVHNENGEIIFLGKSRNMKKRVNQLFVSDSKKNRYIQKEVKAVTYEKTGSELVALLKENDEVKKNRPKYNVKKERWCTHALYQDEDKNGYLRLRIGKADSRKKSVTTFSSYQQAYNVLHKIDGQFTLCNKLNGLSEAKENCYNYTINKCNGACIGEEDVKAYNKHVKKAMFTYSLNKQSFIIIDRGRDVDERSAIWIQDGKLKGIGFYNLNYQIDNPDILESIITKMEDSPITKHIIESYLRKKKVLKLIKLKTNA